MHVPEQAPARCPVCETAYDSVSEHADGVAVNLLDNERYRRVCFEPVTVDGRARLRFYHHTHEEVSASDNDAAGRGETVSATERPPNREAPDEKS